LKRSLCKQRQLNDHGAVPLDARLLIVFSRASRLIPRDAIDLSLIDGHDFVKEEKGMQYKGFLFCSVLLGLILFLSTVTFAAETHQGKVLAVGAGKLTIVDAMSHTQLTQDVASDADILCENKQCGLSDVKAGDLVMVTVDKDGNKTVATKIEVKKAGSSS
jgi:hypothetical protein